MSVIKTRRVPILARQFLLGAAILISWEWSVASKVLDPFFFSRPSQIALGVWNLVVTGVLWPHLIITFLEAALSFAIGSALGIVCGFVLARSPATAALLEPYLRIGN